MQNPAVYSDRLTRLFGALSAVEDVTLSAAPGRFFGFLGPNGAGKSTTIKMLTGLLGPSGGTIDGVASTLSGSEQQQHLTWEETFLAILSADGHRESTQELSWLA